MKPPHLLELKSSIDSVQTHLAGFSYGSSEVRLWLVPFLSNVPQPQGYPIYVARRKTNVDTLQGLFLFFHERCI